MRHTLTLLMAVTIACTSNAQFDALPDSDATWTESFWVGPGYPYEGFHYAYDAVFPDTVYNGDVYRKLMETYSNNGTVYGTNYGGALRDNGLGQVYFWAPGAPDPALLYDFDVAVGDTLYDVAGLFITDVRVLGVDTVIVNGTPRRRVSVECLDGPSFYGEEWTQGIGSNHGLVHGTPCGSVSGIGELVCMTVNDTVQWGVNAGAVGDCSLLLGAAEAAVDERVGLYPNPAEDRLSITCGACVPLCASIVAMDGRVVHQQALATRTIDVSAMPAGVYLLRVQQGDGKVLTKRFVKR